VFLRLIFAIIKYVQLLLECGANVDAQDKDGKTVLHFAVEKGRSVIIELF
jgi:ankyrin repeat protein